MDVFTQNCISAIGDRHPDATKEDKLDLYNEIEALLKVTLASDN